jgi:ATP-binding cassette subfamily A (ABC1) protein 3
MAHIPQMYLFSYIFKVSSTGFAALTAFNILTSQATLLPVTILSLPQLGLVDTSVALEWLFLILIPNFSIGQAFIDLYTNDAIKAICEPLEPTCGFFPNICCDNYNSNPYRCGVNGPEDCLKWNSNFLRDVAINNKPSIKFTRLRSCLYVHLFQSHFFFTFFPLTFVFVHRRRSD